jgi:hypothetical protein
MISENSKLFCIVSVLVLRIRDVYPDPGSREDSLKIEVVLTLKTVSKLLGKIKRSGMFTLDLRIFFPIVDPGSQIQGSKSTGSRIRIRNTARASFHVKDRTKFSPHKEQPLVFFVNKPSEKTGFSIEFYVG